MCSRIFGILLSIAALSCTPEQSETTGGAAPEDATYTVAVVPKGLGHQFWLTVKAGAEAAGEDYDAAIIWTGPEKETQVVEQINILEDMISRNVDAIVMAATDEQALIDTVQKAMDAGIPVVTIDSGVKSDLPVSFVATDNIAGAKAAADKLVDLIGGEGAVGLLPFVPGAATSEQREQGFKEGLANHPNVELVSSIHTHSDVARAMNATTDMLTANPDLKGIFATNEPAAIGAIQALEAAGKTGDVKLVAFDASQEELDALRRGAIQALIVQNPYRMGYEGVESAIAHLEGQQVDKRIDTGVTIVTQDNLNDPEVQQLLNPQH